MNSHSKKLIRLSKAFVGQEELKQVERVLYDTVNFGLGIHVQEFEEKLKIFLRTDYDVIAVNTGTSALHLALEALNAPAGAEVLVPSITFVASYSAISAAGLIPVSCEVLTPSCHIDPVDAARRVTDKTVAIMPVAYAGVDFDRESIYQLAQKHNLRVIEDDAHAFGSRTHCDKMIGSVGDIICFSFDGIKNITCGEGGAIVTNDKELARKIKIMRSLGIEKDVDLRYQGQRAWEYDVAIQGYRYHMSNINAAIGVAQLERFPSVMTKKRTLWECYYENIASNQLENYVTPTQKFDSRSCVHIMSCLLSTNLSRKEVMEKLRAQGIESGFHYVPNHLHTKYRANYKLNVAEDLGHRLLSLPFHPGVTKDDIKTITKELAKIIFGSK